MRNVVTGRKPEHLRFRNPSNTNVMEWGGKVLTFYETSLPHRLDPASLGTIGLDNLGGALRRLPACAAHFHFDHAAGTVTYISNLPAVGKHRAQVLFSEFDQQWRLVHQQHHTIDGLNYAHDFAMTEHYYIVQMTPFVDVAAKSLALGISTGLASPGGSMKHHPHLPSAIVLVPRGKRAAGLPVTLVDPPHLAPIVLADTSPVHIFHFGHASEASDGTVSFSAVTLAPPFNMEYDHRVWLSNFTKAPGRLCVYTVDPGAPGRKPSLARRQADRAACEFPGTNPWRHGAAERFVYLMANDRGEQRLPFRDVVKADLGDGSGRQVWYSEGLVSEPVFVPARRGGGDDDGFVITQMYHPRQHRTEIVILDARHIDRGPVCRLRLRHHFPFAFHCTYSPTVCGVEPSDLLPARAPGAPEQEPPRPRL